jgi:hypothetical protein
MEWQRHVLCGHASSTPRKDYNISRRVS